MASLAFCACLRLRICLFLCFFFRTLCSLLCHLQNCRLAFTLFVLCGFRLFSRFILFFRSGIFRLGLSRAGFKIGIKIFNTVLNGYFIKKYIEFVFFEDCGSFLGRTATIFIKQLYNFLVAFSEILGNIGNLDLNYHITDSSLTDLFA